MAWAHPLLRLSLYGTFLGPGPSGQPFPVPMQFLAIVLLMTHEPARNAVAADALSERERERLVHASRLAIVGELTASIAHEINQPLGAILSNAEAGEILLERADPPLDEIRQILADIRRDGLRAGNVIRHVRMLVRNQEFALEPLDANAIAADVIALVAPDAHRRCIGLESSLTSAPACFRGDRARIEQVLLNLILNAMDAMEAANATEAGTGGNLPPVILGVARMDHGEIEFRIVDAGVGIPADRLDHLFDSFYTTKAHGMGLGLSITRSIVEAHGGSIRAENNPGAGATFRVTLPPFQKSA